jgi:hypothetical protein
MVIITRPDRIAISNMRHTWPGISASVRSCDCPSQATRSSDRNSGLSTGVGHNNAAAGSHRLTGSISIQRLIVIGRRAFFQRADIAAAEILFWRRLCPSLVGFADLFRILFGFNRTRHPRDIFDMLGGLMRSVLNLRRLRTLVPL